MKPLVSVSIALVLASLPAAASAQVTQTYQYDANGRLTGVSTTGSGGTNTAAYAYDDADNRTSRSQTGTSAYAAILRLPIGEPLLPTHALVSADGRFSLALRASGELELRPSREAEPAAEENDLRTAFAVEADGVARFRTELAPSAAPGVYLALTDEGDLVMRDSIHSVLWHSDICCH